MRDIENESDLEQRLNEEIIELDTNEFLDFISEQIIATDVIMDGYNMAINIDMGMAICYSGIARTRLGLEYCLEWIKNHSEIPPITNVLEEIPDTEL